ncbi:D-amino acid dehydrogenase [Paraburkholderia rhizosphaerae]|uniref:D-amino-acid dehydrogenase n=1 Tax=Paraburkholderia rhizosphaerae TaxID=480658 RepID=A0A4R8LB55_9BURK|nr:D-amino acid dehydrogenase [Paraburkholderia rhizosphaerae]TDY40142.1 D-amino-acid dehydrogenase [Paraburkholderia rhizosphaerae]
MKTIVLGAGVIGVATAFYLRERGCDVTVVERETDVALETSFANAGVIAPGYVTPWAAPGMPAKILKYLFRPASPLIFRPTLDVAQWRWIGRWLRECELERFRANKQRMQRVAHYSRACLHEFRAAHPFEYRRSHGYLQLFRTGYDVEHAQPALAVLRDAGVPHRELSGAQCVAIEPGLRWARHAPTAGLYLPDDECGDCAAFTRELRVVCERRGVQFRFDTRVSALDVRGGAARGVHVESVQGSETLAANAVVVAAGVDSAALLEPSGVRVPLYPVKGYSATLQVIDDQKAPRAALMDEALKTAITRLGPNLRVAGTAELGDRQATLREQSLRTLLKVLDDWFPHASAPSSAQFWVGRRPMMPDGAPLLGPSGIDHLWLNIGHGSTGWAMALGSGRVVADLVTQRRPEIDLDGLTIARYRG